MNIIRCIAAFLALFASAVFAAEDATPGGTLPPATNTVAAVKAETPAAQERRQCEAITKSGKRCSRKAVRGEKMCRQHLKLRGSRK